MYMVCLVAVSVVAPDPVRQELILVIRIRSTGPDPGDPDLKEKNDLIVFARFTILLPNAHTKLSWYIFWQIKCDFLHAKVFRTEIIYTDPDLNKQHCYKWKLGKFLLNILPIFTKNIKFLSLKKETHTASQKKKKYWKQNKNLSCWNATSKATLYALPTQCQIFDNALTYFTCPAH